MQNSKPSNKKRRIMGIIMRCGFILTQVAGLRWDTIQEFETKEQKALAKLGEALFEFLFLVETYTKREKGEAPPPEGWRHANPQPPKAPAGRPQPAKPGGKMPDGGPFRATNSLDSGGARPQSQ